MAVNLIRPTRLMRNETIQKGAFYENTHLDANTGAARIDWLRRRTAGDNADDRDSRGYDYGSWCRNRTGGE